MKTLSPLIERFEADIMGSDLLHADDAPIRVLDRSLRDKGLGKEVRQDRIWAYVRDQRTWAGSSPPGDVYRFAPNWKEEHVLIHTKTWHEFLNDFVDDAVPISRIKAQSLR